MTAIWMRVRAEWRANWRTWVGLGLLLGIFAGAAIAAAAGARRTNTVVERAIALQRAPDVFMVPAFTVNGDLLDFDKISEFPSVQRAERFMLLGSPDAGADVGVLPPSGFDPGSMRVLDGVIPSTSDPDSAFVNYLARDRHGWKPGTRLTFSLAGPGWRPDQEPGQTVTVTVRVTAVTSTLGDFTSQAQPGIFLTPAFLKAHAVGSFDLYMMRLRDGRASEPSFDASISALTGGRPVFYVKGRDGYEQANRSFHLQALALWLLAGFVVLATVLIFGQTIARFISLQSDDHGTLASLGVSHRSLFALGCIRVAVVGIVGALVAAATAAAASGIFPLGYAGLAEPSPGFIVAPATLAFGAAVALLATMMLGVVPAWRASRARDPELSMPTSRPSRLARLVAVPAAAVGIRLALEPGRGRTAVPVRSTLACAALGIVALAAAVTVGQSMQHFLETPRLYGWDWDVGVSANGGSFEAGGDAERRLASVAGVGEFSVGGVDGAIFNVGGRTTEGIILSPARGDVHPPILDGRLPAGADEIALGRKTLRAIGAHVGDRVEIGLLGSATRRQMHIVGVAVLPFSSDQSALGEGVFMRVAGIRTLDASAPSDGAAVRFVPGADRDAVIAALRKEFGERSVYEGMRPSAVVDFGRVSALPFVVAGIVGLLAAGTIMHVLISAIRRRRRDLAILKTLGFVRGQVRAAVASQATTVTLGALLFGLPLGIAGGRWAWIAFASSSGFAAETIVPTAQLAIVVLGALVLANIIAAIPAHIAARTQPALVLRSE